MVILHLDSGESGDILQCRGMNLVAFSSMKVSPNLKKKILSYCFPSQARESRAPRFRKPGWLSLVQPPPSWVALGVPCQSHLPLSSTREEKHRCVSYEYYVAY